MRRPPAAPVASCLLNGTTITDTGKTLKLPGQPASMRGRAR